MLIKAFKQISKNDVSSAGGKGASLGEMIRAKIPVPSGFVVLVEAFDRFLEETDLVAEIASQIKQINFKDINSVDKASNVIRDLISDTGVSKELERAFQGELETYLNTDKNNLIENIKNCWSSLFTPRALFYAFEKGIITQAGQKKIRAKTCKKLAHCYSVAVAVVVQKMVQSEISGISFTVHSVTQDRNQMVIEAGYGLGEAIVGGKITPDTYVISKKDRVIIDANISDQEMMIIRQGNGIKETKVPKNKQSKQKLPNK